MKSRNAWEKGEAAFSLHKQETLENRLYLPASPLSVRESIANLAEHRVGVSLNREVPE
jgi:hypothetical protein